MAELLENVLQRYDGPVLVERLAHLALNSENETSYRAAFEALRHLDSVSQYSPYIEQLLNKAQKLEDKSDAVMAQLYRCTDPGWINHLQDHKIGMLRNLNVENLYHEKDHSKHVKVATIYMYNKQFSEAYNALSSTGMSVSTCKLAEYAAQVGILHANYLHISTQEKRIDAFLSTCQSNEMYLKRLTREEVSSYWRTRILILFTHFLRQNFKEVVDEANELINAQSIATFEGEAISAIDVLGSSDFLKFIHKDEIRIAIAISTLISKQPNELNDYMSTRGFISLMGPMMADVRPLATALTTANFKSLFQLLDDMTLEAESNLLLNKVWSDIKLKFRRKGYLLYLSLVKRVPLQHLAVKLNVECTRLLRELKDLIKEEELEFAFVQDDTILESITTDKKASYFERLQRLSEVSDTIESDISQKLQSQRQPVQQRQQSSMFPPVTRSALQSMSINAITSAFGGSSSSSSRQDPRDPRLRSEHTRFEHDK